MSAADIQFPPQVKAKYDIGKKLGNGAFGVAYLLLDKVTSEKVVLKIITNNDPIGDKENKAKREELARREVRILRFQHLVLAKFPN